MNKVHLKIAVLLILNVYNDNDALCFTKNILIHVGNEDQFYFILILLMWCLKKLIINNLIMEQTI